MKQPCSEENKLKTMFQDTRYQKEKERYTKKKRKTKRKSPKGDADLSIGNYFNVNLYYSAKLNRK